MADEGCNGARGDPVFRRTRNGDLELYDHGKGAFEPFDPSQGLQRAPANLSGASSRIATGDDRRATNYGMSSRAPTTPGNSYDQFSADPHVLGASDAAAQQPLPPVQPAQQPYMSHDDGLKSGSSPALHGGAPALSVSGSRSRYGSQTSMHSGRPDARRAVVARMPDGLVHETGVVEDGVTGNRYAPRSAFYFPYEFKVAVNMRVNIDTTPGAPPVVRGFDHDFISSQIVQSIFQTNTERPERVLKKDVLGGLDLAFVYGVVVNEVDSTVHAPVGISLVDHPAMNSVVDHDTERNFMYVMGGKGSKSPNFEHSLHSQFYSPAMCLLANYAGTTDMSEDYVVKENYNSRYCDVRWDSLLWAMGGVYSAHGQRWMQSNRDHSPNSTHVQRVPVSMCKDWANAGAAYVEQSIALRPLLPRKERSRGDSPDALRLAFHVLHSDDGASLHSKKHGYINITITVMGRLAIKTSRKSVVAMYERRARTRPEYAQSVPRSHIFLPEGHGEIMQDMWSKFSQPS
jgi:hypothetical protein